MVSPRSNLVFLAFPLLLAATGLFAPACGSSVAGTGGGTSTGSGGAAGCPAQTPQDGTPCAGVSGECHYPVSCCADTIATCPGGTWSVMPGPCIGEVGPDPCPATQPNDGDPCTPGCLPVQCSYGDCGDGTPAAFAYCEGTWQVTANCPADAGGGGIPQGGACGQDADGGMCAAGLACCYPCGIPGCTFKCTTACQPSDPGCNNGCVPVP